jgi:hypothetical protein
MPPRKSYSSKMDVDKDKVSRGIIKPSKMDVDKSKLKPKKVNIEDRIPVEYRKKTIDSEFHKIGDIKNISAAMSPDNLDKIINNTSEVSPIKLYLIGIQGYFTSQAISGDDCDYNKAMLDYINIRLEELKLLNKKASWYRQLQICKSTIGVFSSIDDLSDLFGKL